MKKKPYRRSAAPRRAPGEGSIYEVKDATGKVIAYEGSIDLEPGLNGKRKRKRVRAKTKTEVALKLKALRKEQAAGVDIGTPKQTIAQFFEHWLKDVILITSAPKTLADYRHNVKHYIIPRLGHIKLDQLKQQHIQEWIWHLQKQKHHYHPDKLLSERVVEHALEVLQRGLNRAIEERMISFNPATLIEVPSGKAKIQALTQDQAKAFLKAIAGTRLELVYHLLIFVGLRQGEALGLMVEDIDTIACTVNVKRTAQYVSGLGNFAKEPKTPSATRLVPMPRSLADRLKAHIGERQSGWLFPSRDGNLMYQKTLDRDYKHMLTKAGLPTTFRLHDLRHTCATMLLDAGENPVNVAAQLGHSSTTTTLRVYAHAVAVTQKRAIEDLSKQLMEDEDE